MCVAINTHNCGRRAASNLLGVQNHQLPPRLLLHAPCTEDHFQPVRGLLRPWFKLSTTLCSTQPFPTPIALAIPLAVLGRWQPKNGIDFTAPREHWHHYPEPSLYKGQNNLPGYGWTKPINFCVELSRSMPGVAQPMVEFSFVFAFKRYQWEKKKNKTTQ